MMNYPEMIRNLPEAEIPFEGVKGRLMQGAERQIVFFEIEPIGAVAEHKHGDQWNNRNPTGHVGSQVFQKILFLKTIYNPLFSLNFRC